MSITVSLLSQTYELLPEKAVWQASCSRLIVSDIHLGKTSHFRKHGVYLPLETRQNDLEKLNRLLKQFQAKELMILGDLFHSDLNSEWDNWIQFIEQYPNVLFRLIMGNHDVLPNECYHHSNMEAVSHHEENGISYVHDSVDSKEKFCFSGHLHPGVVMEGFAKQKLKLPCFALNANQFLMPAFGYLTGLMTIEQNQYDSIYAIGESRVFKIK
jgi:uncharacterized protein